MRFAVAFVALSLIGCSIDFDRFERTSSPEPDIGSQEVTDGGDTRSADSGSGMAPDAGTTSVDTGVVVPPRDSGIVPRDTGVLSADSGTVMDSGPPLDSGVTLDSGVPRDSGTAPPATPPGYVRISAGTFTMGSPPSEPDRRADEVQHTVTISRPFFVKETEVTQAEWQSLMGNNPSQFTSCGSSCPVENVNWFDAAAYANALSVQGGLQVCYVMSGCSGTPGVQPYYCTGVNFAGLSCSGYRLPTEAEWEYATRAGTTGPYSTSGSLDDVAWYNGNAGSGTHQVRTRAANPWGLYDVHGNVAEWVQDVYGDYPTGSVTDPTGPGSGNPVYRGGDWSYIAAACRSAYRANYSPTDRYNTLGFRPVRMAE